MQLQVEQLTETLKARDVAPLDPVATGLLVPKVVGAKKRERNKTRIDESEGGDSHLRNLATKARAKQVGKAIKAAEVSDRKAARVEKQAQITESRAAQLDAFMRCTPMCLCGLVPCPMAEMYHCTVCGDIKKSVCRKKACVGDGPLLLTMHEPESPVLALTE